MNINYEREELCLPVSKDELTELKNRVIYLIEGYKYFYMKDANSMEGDPEARNISDACLRILKYFRKELLYKDEKRKFLPIICKETVNNDVQELKDLFSNCRALNERYLMPKALYRSLMQVFMDTEEDFSFGVEHNDFAKLVFAAGAVNMHKDEIEKVTGKPLNLTIDKKIDNVEIESEQLDRVIDVLNSKEISYEKKDKLIVSINFITDYLKMINDQAKDSEYYMVEDAEAKKLVKPRL